MSRTITLRSEIDVVGTLWMGGTAAMSYPMDRYAIANARDDAGELTRESIERWLLLHHGDFASVTDFRVTISLPDGFDLDSDFACEESEMTFLDCMFPAAD